MNFGRNKLILETGRIARQADGAVLVRLDDTVVLVTVVGKKEVKPGQDFVDKIHHCEFLRTC